MNDDIRRKSEVADVKHKTQESLDDAPQMGNQIKSKEERSWPE